MNTPMISSTSERGRAFLGIVEVADKDCRTFVKVGGEKPKVVRTNQPSIRMLSMQMQELKDVVIWDNFFKGWGRELLAAGAIGVKDLEVWQYSKSNIVNIGIPAYTFLRCFFTQLSVSQLDFSCSIFALQLVQLMCSHHFFLFEESPVTERVNAWNNGGVPPVDEIKSARMHNISRSCKAFCSMLSRLPSFGIWFHEVAEMFKEPSVILPGDRIDFGIQQTQEQLMYRPNSFEVRMIFY
ncbi:hypothetical protein IFM89_032823 [Coptis chinensis]|uniref:Uncharacterized protein n=1 Tax=Coptis chinensis TaxID=261450 RepID=A0A835HNL2_9MAGN|nr:hypothetical protein IFM89_032823 [Coptis chinensis]